MDGLLDLSVQVYASEKSDDDSVIVVSMGDSYSSGEGIEPFYGQDDDVSIKVKNADWIAHRSTKAWPGLLTVAGLNGQLSNYKDVNWYFVATSGAKTSNFSGVFKKTYAIDEQSGSYTIAAQLDVFEQFEEDTVDYVTMTIGGNDVDFKNIIKTAAMSSTYIQKNKLSDKLNSVWDQFYAEDGIESDILNAYVAVAEAAGENASIIVAGYPQLLDKNGKGLLFSKQEATLINANVSRFNQALEELVESCSNSGINIYFVSVEEAFEGHEAYSDDAYINSISFVTPSSDTQDLITNTIDVSAYSVHPNEVGAQVYAACVQAKINELESSSIELDVEKEALEKDINADALCFDGTVNTADEIVLKYYSAMSDFDYSTMIECMNPSTAIKLRVWKTVIMGMFKDLTEDDLNTLASLLKIVGGINIEVIECYIIDTSEDAESGFLDRCISKIPLINNIVNNDASVYVKYRYYVGDTCFTYEKIHQVHRYSFWGWRIDN